MSSIFMDKAKEPTKNDLKKALGKTFDSWQALADFTHKSYPGAKETWNFYSAKFGWSFRISDKRRVLIYMIPLERSFNVTFVFGQKATDEILISDIAESIKNELKASKIYPEGRVIRIDVKGKSLVGDIKKLITAKIAH